MIWLYDILLHAPTVEKLFESIRSFFKLFAKYYIKQHPAKYILFTKEVFWCGRLTSADAIRYDPRGLNGLLHMEPPTNGVHL